MAKHVCFKIFRIHSVLQVSDEYKNVALLLKYFLSVYFAYFQLFARLGSSRKSVAGLEPSLFGDDGPTCSDIIEVYGSDGCGKSQLLLHLAASCILPSSWLGVPLKGLSVSVMLIDTDYHFSIMRLACLLESRVMHMFDELKSLECMPEEKVDVEQFTQWRPTMPVPTSTMMDAFIKTCLQRLYVVHCSGSEELLATLCSLESILSVKPEFSLLLIDSISAFYWIDKPVGQLGHRNHSIQQRVVDVLEHLRSMYPLTVMVTKQEFYGCAAEQSDTSGTQLFSHQEYMCRAWQRLVTCRIICVARGQLFCAQVSNLRNESSLVEFNVMERGVVFKVNK